MKARTLNLKKIYVQHKKKKTKTKQKQKQNKKKSQKKTNNYKFWTFISNLSYKMFDGRSSS